MPTLGHTSRLVFISPGAAILPCDGNPLGVDLVAFVDHCLLGCRAQALLIGIALMVAVTPDHFRSDLNPHYPLFLGRIPGDLNTIGPHAYSMAETALTREPC